MAERHFRPKLNKKLIATCEGYRIYSVSALAIRNAAQSTEEFDSFATHEEFPDLLPEDEIWISEKLVRREGRFFIADALAHLKARVKGASENAAYVVGLNAQRRLRRQVTGAKYRAGRPHKRVPGKVYSGHYLSLLDESSAIDVWLVDGLWIRSLYRTDYTQGGHGYVYPWCPKPEIWIEKDLDHAEIPFVVAHEYVELRLMRDDGMAYDRAHEISAEVEFDLRRPDHAAAFPGLSRRAFRKSDLAALTSPTFFEYVHENYMHRIRRRAGALLSKVASKISP